MNATDENMLGALRNLYESFPLDSMLFQFDTGRRCHTFSLWLDWGIRKRPSCTP